MTGKIDLSANFMPTPSLLDNSDEDDNVTDNTDGGDKEVEEEEGGLDTGEKDELLGGETGGGEGVARVGDIIRHS